MILMTVCNIYCYNIEQYTKYNEKVYILSDQEITHDPSCSAKYFAHRRVLEMCCFAPHTPRHPPSSARPVVKRGRGTKIRKGFRKGLNMWRELSAKTHTCWAKKGSDPGSISISLSYLPGVYQKKWEVEDRFSD